MLLYDLTTKLINYIITNNIRYVFNTNYLCSEIIHLLFMCYELQTMEYIFMTVLNSEYILHIGNMYISKYLKYIFKPDIRYIDDILYIFIRQYVPIYCAFDGDSIYLLLTKYGFIVVPKLFIDTKSIDKLVVLKINVLAIPILQYKHIPNDLTLIIKSIDKKKYMTTVNEEEYVLDTPLYVYIYDETIIPAYITVQNIDNLECKCETQCLSALIYYNGNETIIYYCKNNELQTNIFNCICFLSE